MYECMYMCIYLSELAWIRGHYKMKVIFAPVCRGAAGKFSGTENFRSELMKSRRTHSVPTTALCATSTAIVATTSLRGSLRANNLCVCAVIDSIR